MLPKLSLLEHFITWKGQREIEKWIVSRRDSISSGLNIGCGQHPISGLINVDKYSELADLKMDIADLPKSFPGTVEHIEAHHVIEHLSFSEVESFCLTCFNLLDDEKYGTLVVTCPDLTSISWRFLRSKVLPWKRHEHSYCFKMLYGSQENEGMFHRSGFTRESLTLLLQRAGFSSIFSFSPFPQRPTPSLCLIAEKGICR